jgi:hypothetical protein
MILYKITRLIKWNTCYPRLHIRVCSPTYFVYIFFSSRFSIQEQLAISKLTQMGWQQGRTYLGNLQQLLKTCCYSYNFGKNTKFLLQQLLKPTCYLSELAIHRPRARKNTRAEKTCYPDLGASEALPGGLGDAPGQLWGWSWGVGLTGARRTAASATVPRRRGEEVPRPPVRRRRWARAAIVTRKVNGALRSLSGALRSFSGPLRSLAGFFILISEF